MYNTWNSISNINPLNIFILLSSGNRAWSPGQSQVWYSCFLIKRCQALWDFLYYILDGRCSGFIDSFGSKRWSAADSLRNIYACELSACPVSFSSGSFPLSKSGRINYYYNEFMSLITGWWNSIVRESCYLCWEIWSNQFAHIFFLKKYFRLVVYVK